MNSRLTQQNSALCRVQILTLLADGPKTTTQLVAALPNVARRTICKAAYRLEQQDRIIRAAPRGFPGFHLWALPGRAVSPALIADDASARRPRIQRERGKGIVPVDLDWMAYYRLPREVRRCQPPPDFDPVAPQRDTSLDLGRPVANRHPHAAWGFAR